LSRTPAKPAFHPEDEMKGSATALMASACTIALVAGTVRPASAVNVTAPSVYFYSLSDYGSGAGSLPGHPTWFFQAGPNISYDAGPGIDLNGRIFFRYPFTGGSTTLGPATNYAIFTASTTTDLAPWQSTVNGAPQTWITGMADNDVAGANMRSNGVLGNPGTNVGFAQFGTFRISGPTMGIGTRIGAISSTSSSTGAGGIYESVSGSGASAILQNNSLLYTGTYGAQTKVFRNSDTVSLSNTSDWLVSPTGTVLANTTNTLEKTSGINGTFYANSQWYTMNSSGTWTISANLSTNGPNGANVQAGVFQDATHTYATGTDNVIGTLSSSGVFTQIARSGDFPYGAGGPQFIGGSYIHTVGSSNILVYSNAVGGFNVMINRNGQVFFDAQFSTRTGNSTTGSTTTGPGGMTAANQWSGWIYTPGSGTPATTNIQFYQANNNLPVITGSSDGTARFTGDVNTGSRCFSNAGLLYQASTTGGDTVSAGSSRNDTIVQIGLANGANTLVYRQNALAPFAGSFDLRMGATNQFSMCMNNSGTLALPMMLQGTSGLIPTVAPGVDSCGNILVPGTFGDDQALVVGTPGNLRIAARKGDPAPGYPGLYLNYNISDSAAAIMNNSGDIVFRSDLWDIPPGTVYSSKPGGIAGAMFYYDAATNQITPIHVGLTESIEVAPGVNRIALGSNVSNTSDGNGSSMGFNDNGQLAMSIRVGSGPYVPPPCTGPGGTQADSTVYVVMNLGSSSGIPGVCCQADGTCTIATAGNPAPTCATGSVVANGTCSPNTCAQPSGACCSGATCFAASAAACTGPNTHFAGTGTVCNAPGNNVSPCCRADFDQSGSVTVSDIFTYLNAWFGNDSRADVDGGGLSVQDIFGFLNMWFAGC
jgi:hypothetical protein